MSEFQGFDMPPAAPSINELMASVVPTHVNEQAIAKAPAEHTAHEPDPEERRLIEEMKLKALAGRTKFATGDPERDLLLYKKFLGVRDQITEMLGE